MTRLFSEALALASHISNPNTVIVFALIFLLVFFHYRKKVGKNILILLILGYFIVAAIPKIAEVYENTRNVYRVRVAVRAPDGQSVRDAIVRSEAGEIKTGDSVWVIEVSPRVLPASRRLSVTAQRPETFQSGQATVELKDDYFPSLTIVMQQDPEVDVRGMIRYSNGMSVAQALVGIVGFREVVYTNELGNFQISSHAAKGQMVKLYARKGGLFANRLVPAGSDVEITIKQN